METLETRSIDPEMRETRGAYYVIIQLRVHPKFKERWKKYLDVKGYKHHGGSTRHITTLMEIAMGKEGI